MVRLTAPLAAFGYQVGKPNSEFAEIGLLTTFIAVPAVFHFAMAALVWNFPIDRRRQGIILRRLRQRAAASAI